MNCAEFQKVLPYIIETGGNAEEEAHLRSCTICSDLVQDLRYIAEQAKLLVPMHNPPPRVWAGIRSVLEREGMVRPVAGTVRFRPQAAAILNQRRWAANGGLLAFAALLLLGVSVLWFRNTTAHQAETAAMTSSVAAPSTVEDEDTRVLDVVKQKAPAMLATYRENLESVNSYIHDAKRSVEEDPDDPGVRDHLIRAYDEKALLYEMALSRSME